MCKQCGTAWGVTKIGRADAALSHWPLGSVRLFARQASVRWIPSELLALLHGLHWIVSIGSPSWSLELSVVLGLLRQVDQFV